MVFALAGDSTMTRLCGMALLFLIWINCQESEFRSQDSGTFHRLRLHQGGGDHPATQ
jgi:hypothetical protein